MMRELMARFFLFLLGITPLSFNRWLGKKAGILAWKKSAKNRHIALTNLKLCFPEKDSQWHESVAKKSFQHMAITLIESPKLWKMSRENILSLCTNYEAFDAVSNDYNKGQGLIIATPHMGCWEYGGIIFACIHPLTNLYRPPRMASIEKTITRGRSNTGAKLVPTNISGIKALARALKNGEAIGMLPDQEATIDNGVFAPLFSVAAYTMTLLPKLAQRRNSPVYFFFIERLEGKLGYRIHRHKANPGIYSKDSKTACIAMNKDVEAIIRLMPEQYNWAYKRFNITPDGKQLY